MAHATGKRTIAALCMLIGVPLLPVGIGILPLYIGWKMWREAKKAEKRAEMEAEYIERQLNES